MSRIFWIVFGAAAILVWLHWDEIVALIENRKAIGAGAKAAGALGDLFDAGKELYHEVVE